MTPIHDKNEVPRSPFEAFHRVVYEFPEGVKALAELMGRRPGVLYNKADADAESHHQPTLRDVIDVTRESGDTRILESLDRMFNRVGVQLPTGAQVLSDEALLELLCRVGSEHGDMHRALQKALEDGKFADWEVQAVRQEALDLIAAVVTFMHRLEGMSHGPT